MIGASPITALDGTDTSTEATVAIQIYETAVKDLLSRCRWRFASKQDLLLPTSGTALARWDATFDLPAGTLVIHALTLGGKKVEFDRYGDQIGAMCLTTDAPVIDYGYRVDESLWPSYFDSYVELHLAAIFAYAIANQLDLSDFLEKKAARAFAFAKNQDGQGRTTKKLETSRFLQVRGFSTGADDGYSGSAGGGGGDVGIVLAGVRDGTLPGVDTPIPVANGGTGANTVAGARTNLGLGTIATQAASAVAITGGTITGGTITGITDLAIADGGTGASDAATARTNLGLGTIATQAASAVAITGGTINATVIGGTTTAAISGTTITGTNLVGPHDGTVGATTPAAGTFTTISANNTSVFTGGVGKNAFGAVQASSFLAINGSSTATQTYGVNLSPTHQSTATVWRGFFAQPSTAAASFTITSHANFVSDFGTLGAGSAITSLYGYLANAAIGTSGATSAFGYHSNLASASNVWNFFAGGTANNAFLGNTRFGGVTAPTATVDVTGSIAATTTIKSSGATSGIGYDTGAGGTQTQGTSRTTGVTLNTICGKITLFSTTTTAGTFASFTVTNSAVAATDVVVVNIGSGATADRYNVTVTAVAAGSFRVQIHNVAAVGTAEAPVLNFAVIKAVTA
jgi:hypothetical protein